MRIPISILSYRVAKSANGQYYFEYVIKKRGKTKHHKSKAVYKYIHEAQDDLDDRITEETYQDEERTLTGQDIYFVPRMDCRISGVTHPATTR